MTVASEELTATLEAGLGKLGYDRDRLVADYEFSDVGAPAADTRSVRLAAFTHSPPSYRSAAFGVIDAEGEPGVTDRLGWLSSLGAPVVFVAEGSRVHVMKVGRSRSLSTIATVSPGNVAEFMEAQRAWWAPDAMRRFKLFGGAEVGKSQLDFFDAGLLPAVNQPRYWTQGKCEHSVYCGADQRRDPPLTYSRATPRPSHQDQAAHNSCNNMRTQIVGIWTGHGRGDHPVAARRRVDETWRACTPWRPALASGAGPAGTWGR